MDDFDTNTEWKSPQFEDNGYGQNGETLNNNGLNIMNLAPAESLQFQQSLLMDITLTKPGMAGNGGNVPNLSTTNNNVSNMLVGNMRMNEEPSRCGGSGEVRSISFSVSVFTL